MSKVKGKQFVCEHSMKVEVLGTAARGLLTPAQFRCKDAFENPQFPTYVACRRLMWKEGDECLCAAFREERRTQYFRDNPRAQIRDYVEAVKRSSSLVRDEQHRRYSVC